MKSCFIDVTISSAPVRDLYFNVLAKHYIQIIVFVIYQVVWLKIYLGASVSKKANFETKLVLEIDFVQYTNVHYLSLSDQ